MTTPTGKYLLIALLASFSTGAIEPPPQDSALDLEEYRGADDWFQNGLALNGQGRYPEAAEAFRRVIAIEPGNAVAWLNFGTVQALTGAYQEAIRALEKSLKLEPKLAMGYSNLGEVCFRAGRLQESIDAFGKLLSFWPDNVNAHYKRGLAFLFLEEYKAAEAEYTWLKDVDPQLAGKLLAEMQQHGFK